MSEIRRKEVLALSNDLNQTLWCWKDILKDSSSKNRDKYGYGNILLSKLEEATNLGLTIGMELSLEPDLLEVFSKIHRDHFFHEWPDRVLFKSRSNGKVLCVSALPIHALLNIYGVEGTIVDIDVTKVLSLSCS